MALTWHEERNAHWDEGKARIVGKAAAGVFDSRYAKLTSDAVAPGDWFRVEDGGRTVGYGWLDVSFGDAEILLATDAEARKQGVGAFILDRLVEEAKKRGLHYLTNIVRPTHPDAAGVTRFLTARGFKASEDGRLIRAVKR